MAGLGANWGHEGNWQRGKGLQLNGPKAWKSACDVGHLIRLTDKMGIFPAVNIINKQRNRNRPSVLEPTVPFYSEHRNCQLSSVNLTYNEFVRLLEM